MYKGCGCQYINSQYFVLPYLFEVWLFQYKSFLFQKKGVLHSHILFWQFLMTKGFFRPEVLRTLCISFFLSAFRFYVNANCPPCCLNIIGLGCLSPSLRYSQFSPTIAFAIIGTTEFPIRFTCSPIGYFFQW